VTFVGRSLALALDEATVSARVKDKKSDARALLGAARWLAAHRRADEAVAVYARAARADKGGKAGVAPVAEWEAFSLEHGRSFRKKVAEDAAAFVEKWPAAPNAAEAALFAIRSGQMAPARAKKLWAILLQRTWNQPGALNSLAYSALAAGDHDAALLAAQRAVELSPKDAAVYDTLAEVHHYRGDKDKAVAASDQGIALAQDASFASALKVNRDRFAGGGGAGKAPGPDVEAEKTRAEAEVEEFVRGGAAEDIAVEDDAPPSPEEAAKIEAEQQMRVLQRGATDAFKTASSKCAAQANGLNEAWVRVELTPRGGKPVKVLVIEPGVSAGLKKCLTDSLAQTSFPAAPKAANGRFTGAVKFPR
jgi:tetratricopeptide (TPR) repeat protein